MSYRNPVIPGFHPDPSVCRVGHDYFLVTSSFTYCPGVPIFRSSNLVDWTQIGNVLDRPSQLDLTATRDWSSLGIFAPTIRHHDGRFWMITTNVGTTGTKSFLVTGEDPAGPWSDPVPVPISGIDPDLAWDGDGNCWVHFSGLGGIARCRIDDESGRLLSGPDLTWSGTGLQYPESPHLFERDGTWYLLIAEGGTHSGHCVSVARAPSAVGPWEGAPANPILSHRSTDRSIQNTGHADLVEAADGTWWMVLLGVRPKGIAAGFHVLGRETFLTPLLWVDGWPVPAELALEMPLAPGPTEAPPAARARRLRAARTSAALGRPPPTPGAVSSLTARPGLARPARRGGDPRLSDPDVRGTAPTTPPLPGPGLGRPRLRGGGRATVVMDETAHYDVAVRGDRVVAEPESADSGWSSADCTSARPVVLTVTTGRTSTVPTRSRSASTTRRRTPDSWPSSTGGILATEVTGGFLGRTIGHVRRRRRGCFDWFDYEGV